MEKVSTGRHEELVEGPEEARVAAGEQEARETGPGQEDRHLDQLVPGLGHAERAPVALLERRALLRVLEEISAKVEQPQVEVPRVLEEAPLDPRQLGGAVEEVVGVPLLDHVLQRREPLGLRGRVLGVCREQIDVGLSRAELASDPGIQLGVREAIQHLHSEAGLGLERGEPGVQAVIHRPAHEERSNDPVPAHEGAILAKKQAAGRETKRAASP